jgi:hypothetical protein
MRLFLAFLLLPVLLQHSPSVPPESSAGHQQSKSTAPQQPPDNAAHGQEEEVPETKTIPNAQVRDAEAHQNQTANQEATPKWINEVNAFSTLAIAIFTFVTILVFGYQVKVTHEVERAWITVSLEPSPNGYLEWVEMPTDGSKLSVEGIFKNNGRTPGKMTKAQVRFCYIENVDALAKEPNYSGYSELGNMPADGHVIVPSGEFRVTAFFEGLNDSNIPTQDQITLVRAEKASLFVVGRIQYSDAFSRPHETRFCFTYMMISKKIPYMGRFQLGGPPEYNKAT